MVERDWTTRTPEPGATLEAEGITIRCHRQDAATLVSGDLAAAIKELAPSAQMLGLLELLPGAPFALRIARDRALLCTRDPLASEGWYNGFAASAADDLYLEFVVTGQRAPEVVASSMSEQPGSRSAATLFAGYGALVARLPHGVSVRIQAPEAAAAWAHLANVIKVL